MIVGTDSSTSDYVKKALSRTRSAYRPSTLAAQRTHLRTYLAFVTYMDIQPQFTIQSVLYFLEFLYSNSVSPRVIANYVSSLKTAAKRYKWDSEPLQHQLVSAYLRSISINSTFTPTPKGIFGLDTLVSISKACGRLQDPVLYKAIFLTSLFAFLLMSNIAPHYRARVDPGRHLLRQDIIFASPGAHILLKWSNTM